MVSVVIVNFNGAKYLERNLGALLGQTYRNLEIIMVDNASTDHSVNEVESRYPMVKLIKNAQNVGFCAGNNQGIAASRGEIIMFLNQDVELTPDYIIICEGFLRQKEKVGVVQGKLLRTGLVTGDQRVVDSTGLAIFKNGRAVSRGENQLDQGQFNRSEEVFGADGAAVLLKREALESIRVLGEYEDEDFFMYKDDVDYSWRLRLMGWQIWYLPTAVAYHSRTSSGTGRQGSYLKNIRAFIANETRKKDYVVVFSFKNQWLMLIKNLTRQQFLAQGLFILIRETQLLVFNLAFRPRVFLKYCGVFLRQLPRALRKRKVIQARRTVSSAEVNRWFR